MARQVWHSENPNGFGMRDGKLVVTPGICAGMTAVWCLKMNLGLPLESTKPGLQESIVAQFDYEGHGQSPAALLKEFLPRVRLVIDNEGVWKNTGRRTAASVVDEGDGRTYFWGYPGHAIGAARRGGRYYVFDPDRGLQELDDDAQFRAHLEHTYSDKLPLKEWWLFRVAVDPAQRASVAPGPRR